MFNIESSHVLESSADVYSGDDNMDMILNYDNEFMSSEFFDTIKSVENDIDSNFLNSNETSMMGSISPINDSSESEEKSYTDTSVSPTRSLDTGEDSLLEFLQWPQNNVEIDNLPVIKIEKRPEVLIKKTEFKVVNHQTVPTVKRNPKIVKLQTVSKNGKPIILPYGLKNVKILNAIDLKKENITLKAGKLHRVEHTPFQTIERTRHPANELSEIKLTSEEKRLLEKEGIKLPSNHPLTKAEDRELKRIRRKIRNKISAQDSRKRKKEYVDGLEERVRRGSEDNRNLMQRIKELQRKNKSLRAHIEKLHSMLFNSSSSNAAPSTCLMIIVLSVLLVSLPNFNQMKMKNELAEEQEQVTISRSLLSTKILEDDILKPEDFVMFGKNLEGFDIENKTEEEILESLKNFENNHKADGVKNDFVDHLMNFMKNMFNAKDFPSNMRQFFNSKGFIEPSIDDCDDAAGEPPVKKKCNNYQYMNVKNTVPLNVKTTIPGGANDK